MHMLMYILSIYIDVLSYKYNIWTCIMVVNGSKLLLSKTQTQKEWFLKNEINHNIWFCHRMLGKNYSPWPGKKNTLKNIKKLCDAMAC
jgi:hypothetical protein